MATVVSAYRTETAFYAADVYIYVESAVTTAKAQTKIFVQDVMKVIRSTDEPEQWQGDRPREPLAAVDER